MTRAKGSDWTETEIAIIRPLWTKGVSCAQIARALSEAGHRRTRNAVIGWVSRNLERRGLPRRRSPDAPRRPKGSFNFGAVPSEPSPERKAGLGKVWIKAPRLLPGQTPADGFLITEIPAGGCKYALTADAPHRFCGRPAKPGASYCEPHLKGLTQPAPAPGNPHARETRKDSRK